MLLARAGELDTLMGLEAGADDYITEPFRPRFRGNDDGGPRLPPRAHRKRWQLPSWRRLR